MRIEHIAIWTPDLERLKAFYMKYFNGKPNEKYVNPKTGFESYFITFENGARLEIMHQASIPENPNDPEKQFSGLIHIAFSAGSRNNVDALTQKLREDGYRIAGEPRVTGDGYYESVILDPDGNRIEITD